MKNAEEFTFTSGAWPAPAIDHVAIPTLQPGNVVRAIPIKTHRAQVFRFSEKLSIPTSIYEARRADSYNLPHSLTLSNTAAMSTVGSFNSKSPTMKRIMKEASELSQNPSADYAAHPLEDNIFEWHFTLRGPPAPSPFANGLYHGRITLPTSYPLRPPSFRFLTPSGRFEVNREICLSISGFHEESWQPAWGIRTALLALRGHMDVEARGQVGGLDADEATRKDLASRSGAYTCASCGKSNRAIMEEQMQALAEKGDDAKKVEEKVPEELKLAYREDLGKKEDVEGKTNKLLELEKELQALQVVDEPAAQPPAQSQPQLPQEARPQAEQQAAAALLQLGQTGQLPQPAQDRAGTEDAWLEMIIWAVGAVLAIIIARKVLMTFFT